MNREVVQTSEIERLANIRNELEREVDRMRASLSTIESKYQLEIEEITSEFTSFKKRTQELGELEVRLETERKKHDNQMSLLRQKIFDLENQLALASGEVTRLNGQLEEKLREITELREAVNSTEMVKYGESVKLRAQVEAMKKTHTELNEALLRLEAEKYQLEGQVRQLKQTLDLTREELRQADRERSVSPLQRSPAREPRSAIQSRDSSRTRVIREESVSRTLTARYGPSGRPTNA
eukprot:TRINITY_DN4161_c0_g2_i3.p1 TRINITY_DN4161_c0_g2~~TRINITY_DN4161_c0_g2_i3.p1  ORF type:complete len:238 (-),score=82.78 TRINITY_DN4161_c0_g2_i3:220-933(-)